MYIKTRAEINLEKNPMKLLYLDSVKNILKSFVAQIFRNTCLAKI